MKRMAGLAMAALLAACQQEAQQAATEEAVPAGCLLGANTAIGGPISLVDHSGAAVTQENFHEGMALIYFGYSYCPDVCPLALQMEKLALSQLGEQGQVIQPVLISIDPERDTPQNLAAYVEAPVFPNGLLGLTGTPDQIAAAAKAFRVTYMKDSNDPAYTVSHTSFFYLMDENWRLTAMFPSTLKPAEAAACLRAGLKREENPAG